MAESFFGERPREGEGGIFIDMGPGVRLRRVLGEPEVIWKYIEQVQTSTGGVRTIGKRDN